LILLLVPLGRGRWSPLRQQVPPQRMRHLLPVATKRGDRVVIDGAEYRVSRVEPW
jgi:hypothetical protein